MCPEKDRLYLTKGELFEACSAIQSNSHQLCKCDLRNMNVSSHYACLKMEVQVADFDKYIGADCIENCFNDS